MNQEELNQVIENHKHWLNQDREDWQTMKANLSGADLREMDLQGVNLSYADLSDVDLSYANLEGVNLIKSKLCNTILKYSNLRGANLTEANLYGADLRFANLKNTFFIGTNLEDTNLRGANLTNADLSWSNLKYSNLKDANCMRSNFIGSDFTRANLYGADFTKTNLCSVNFNEANLNKILLNGADLYKANLKKATNLPFIPYACPIFGSFIGYKKAYGYIVELQILEDSKRLSATTRKCRCDKAKVLRILKYDGTVADITEVVSNRDKNFIYKVGEIVSVNNFDENRWNECSTGIHFFVNFLDAVKY